MLKLPGLGAWADDPAWAHVYDWTVTHPRAGGVLWRVGMGADLGMLHRAADELGTLPAGTRVLDVPCGGGVALTGVRPGQGLAYACVDIAPAMLVRTRRTAERLGVADQVETHEADVVDLPWPDGTFGMAVSFTGLHCFPDPRGALAEIVRVLAPGGVLVGSAVLTPEPDLSSVPRALGTLVGLRYAPVRAAGRAAGLLGPMCTRTELERWCAEEGLVELEVTVTGAIGWFRARRPAS